MARDRKFPGVRPIDGWKTLSSNRQTDRPGDSAVRVAIAIVGGRAGEAGDEDFPPRVPFSLRCDGLVLQRGKKERMPASSQQTFAKRVAKRAHPWAVCDRVVRLF